MAPARSSRPQRSGTAGEVMNRFAGSLGGFPAPRGMGFRPAWVAPLS